MGIIGERPDPIELLRQRQFRRAQHVGRPSANGVRGMPGEMVPVVEPGLGVQSRGGGRHPPGDTGLGKERCLGGKFPPQRGECVRGACRNDCQPFRQGPRLQGPGVELLEDLGRDVGHPPGPFAFAGSGHDPEGVPKEEVGRPSDPRCRAFPRTGDVEDAEALASIQETIAVAVSPSDSARLTISSGLPVSLAMRRVSSVPLPAARSAGSVCRHCRGCSTRVRPA